MSTPERPLRIRWDGTVSLGAIIGMVGIAAPVIGGSVTVINQVSGISMEVQRSNLKSDERLKNLEDTTQQIRLDMAKQDGIRTQVMDHEGRIRQLETRR